MSKEHKVIKVKREIDPWNGSLRDRLFGTRQRRRPSLIYTIGSENLAESRRKNVPPDIPSDEGEWKEKREGRGWKMRLPNGTRNRMQQQPQAYCCTAHFASSRCTRTKKWK